MKSHVHALVLISSVLLTTSLVAACGSSSAEFTSLQDLGAVGSDDLGAEVSPDSVLSTLTIDVEVQRGLERVLSERVPDTAGRFVAAAAVVDVKTGAVIVYGVSSPNSFGNLLDRQRPSGSTLKLVVAFAAAQAGILADDGVIGGRNCDFPDGASAPSSETEPIMSIRRAAAISSNCAFGKLTRSLGPERLTAAASRLGIERPLDVSTRFGFGVNTASLRELLGAAATIMGAQGIVRPTLLGGTVEPENPPDDGLQLRRAVTEMMSEVVTAGTASGHEFDGWSVVAKTGTAAGGTDAWMVGGTSEFVVAVWMGNPNGPDDSMSDGAVGGRPRVHGGDLPADIWIDVLALAHRGLEGRVFESVPSDRDPVVIVDDSIDCLSSQEFIRRGPPGPAVAWIETGGPVTC